VLPVSEVDEPMSIHVSLDVVALIAAIVGFGVAAQFLAAMYRVPSVLFSSSRASLSVPRAGLITPDVVGDSLSTIVGVSVAIIIFEGTFRLEYGAIWKTSKAVSRMITIGAVIAFVGTTLTVRLLLGASWDIALLIGALLVATGPTVIAPILAVVPVREEVATTLEVEGIVNDVTAAVLAVVLFKP